MTKEGQPMSSRATSVSGLRRAASQAPGCHAGFLAVSVAVTLKGLAASFESERFWGPAPRI
jgi:hypothetical protein